MVKRIIRGLARQPKVPKPKPAHMVKPMSDNELAKTAESLPMNEDDDAADPGFSEWLRRALPAAPVSRNGNTRERARELLAQIATPPDRPSAGSVSWDTDTEVFLGRADAADGTAVTDEARPRAHLKCALVPGYRLRYYLEAMARSYSRDREQREMRGRPPATSSTVYIYVQGFGNPYIYTVTLYPLHVDARRSLNVRFVHTIDLN